MPSNLGSAEHQSAVLAAVWRWRESDVSNAPVVSGSSHGIGQALLHLGIGATAGTVLFFLGHRTMAAIVWTIAGAIFVSALVAPSIHKTILRGADWLGHAAGRVLTYLLLVPLFFLGFALFGLLFRRGRRDRMERWTDAAEPTYWKTRDDAPRTLAFYERQF